MRNKLLPIAGIVVCLLLCACSAGEISREGSGSSSRAAETPVEPEKSDHTAPSEPPASYDGEVYRYDSIPDFPVSRITPGKITYYKAMLGETTEIVEAERIEQLVAFIDQVEVRNTPVKRVPTKKEEDGELHQVISFYQNADDEEPAYSLCFLTDSLYLEANGASSDVYPTPNWVNKKVDDESKLLNVQCRQLIDSWSEPGFPPLSYKTN